MMWPTRGLLTQGAEEEEDEEVGGLLQPLQFAGKQQNTTYGGTSPYVVGRLTRGNDAVPRSKQASLGYTHESGQSVNKWGGGSPEVRGRDDGCVCV